MIGTVGAASQTYQTNQASQAARAARPPDTPVKAANNNDPGVTVDLSPGANCCPACRRSFSIRAITCRTPRRASTN